MFKERPAKKRIIPSDGASEDSTLDARHQAMMNKIALKYNSLETLQSELAESRQNLERLHERIAELRLAEIRTTNTTNTTDTTNTTNTINTTVTSDLVGEPTGISRTTGVSEEYDLCWSEVIANTDRINELEAQLRMLSTREEEIDYYTETGKILFQYYDLVQNQNQNQNQQSKPLIQPMKTTRRKKAPPIATKSVLDRLNQPAQLDESGGQNQSNDSQAVTNQDTNLQSKPDVNKCDLIDLYLTKVDQSYVARPTIETNVDICSTCKNQLICMYQDGIMFCRDCGYQELMLIEQNRPVYRQVANREASHYSYKRINHFNEWLSQIQGKESTDIPEEIFDKIIQEIKKEKIADTSKLTYSKMREILKRLKGNKYYEHMAYIMQRINNQPSPNFSPELEEKLRSMFKEIQGPFLKHCPPTRKNFLSYSYVIHKCLQLLGKDQYLSCFQLLKSREKLFVQDQIWKKICYDLNWAVYASL